MKYLIVLICVWCLTLSIGNAQDVHKPDKPSSRVSVKVENGAEPDVYIDGKKYDYAILKLIDPAKIESINVVKDEQAMKKYNAPNGVILITSAHNTSTDSTMSIRYAKESSSGIDIDANNVRIRSSSGDEPIVIIDGQVSSKAKLDKLSPELIEKIDVLKGEKAIEEYNATGGVIIITTKKEK